MQQALKDRALIGWGAVGEPVAQIGCLVEALLDVSRWGVASNPVDKLRSIGEQPGDEVDCD